MAVRQMPLDLLPNASRTMDREGPHAEAALASLHAHLLAEYALSLFDLTGIVEYRLDGIASDVMPPIVERSPAETGDDEGALTIVKGAETVALARELGMAALWVVEMEIARGTGGESRVS